MTDLKKTKYVCGSSKPDIFKEMRRIVLHYAHEHPEYHSKNYKDGRVYQALSVLLSPEEEQLVRRDISLIGTPESRRITW